MRNLWLTDETNFDNLTYYFKGATAQKRFDDFENRIKLFGKRKPGDTNLFKPNLKKRKRKT